MKPKIVIDALSLLAPLTGVGRYTFEVSKAVTDSKKFDIEYFYGYFSKILTTPKNSTKVKSLHSFIVKNEKIKKVVRAIVFELSGLFCKKYDLYWQPNFIPNKNIKAKKIITTVHDFSWELYPQFQPLERVEYFKNNFYKMIQKSDYIITGSFFSKEEILQRLDFKEERIKVIYHGINHDIFKVYDDLTLDMELPKKFIFSVGSIEPRKNLLGLLRAYAALPQDLKNEYKLVLAGFKGWENDLVMELIEKNANHIVYLGFVDDVKLAKIYNLASLFVYASFYEGFGLPPLEAMACGTPVVCSSASSLSEVGGDSVVYCDPHDEESIKEKMELLLRDENLREKMAQKGLQRASCFSWEKSAFEHIEVFKEALES